jgi:hypothetical protein
VIGLFKQKSPGNVIILLLFGLLIKLPVFLYPRQVSATANDGVSVPAIAAFSFPAS